MLKALALAGLLVFGLGTTSSVAFAEDIDEGDFSDGTAEPPENTDSEAVPGLGMSFPTYGGSGCPQGTMSAALSPDQKSLSLLFDAYTVRTTAGQARAECTVKIPFNVPSGYQMQVVKIEYRGFAAVPAGAKAKVGANLRFDGHSGRGPLAMRKFARKKQFAGPVEKNFIVASKLRGAHFSPCGESFVINSNSLIEVVSRRGDEVTATIDSADAVGRVPVKMHLRWKRCGHGERPGGRPDNRPNRPGRR